MSVMLQNSVVAERTPIYRGRRLTRVHASAPGVECWTWKVIRIRRVLWHGTVLSGVDFIMGVVVVVVKTWKTRTN